MNTEQRERPVLRGRGVVDTRTPCPLCAADGNHTISGKTPTLHVLDEGDDRRTFCIGRHGYVEL